MSRPEDICPRPERSASSVNRPLTPPIQLSSVWICESTDQVDRLSAGDEGGYIYRRDGHPNADELASKCRELHGAEEVAITASGMSALALAVLSQLAPGDHVLVSDMLYGRSMQLLTGELKRWGATSTIVDTTNLAAVRAALTSNTRLAVSETISNPRLRVADIRGLADLLHSCGGRLLMDNTFATPVLCRPLEWGADLVLESATKLMNGHSDVVLGVLAGRKEIWERVPFVSSVWGLASSPFDCWLAARGLATLALRVERASQNALAVASFLQNHEQITEVDYPGLPNHPQHDLARQLLSGGFGSMVTMHLRGGRGAADTLIRSASRIPFCPSLGELSTTLSHPASTSHRGLSEAEREKLGISGGTIRLSVGLESSDAILDALAEGLRALA